MASPSAGCSASELICGRRRPQVRSLKIANGKEVPSICPYCGVGCGQLVSVRAGKIVNIEGNPESPISRGALCPKGSATFQLAVNPNRVTKVWYRAPGATEWDKTKTLDWAMDRVAQLVKKTRDETFQETWKAPDGTEKTGQPHPGHRLPRRRDHRQRMELHPGQADANAGHGVPRKPGPNMTQRHRARSGHFVWPRRRHHLPAWT